MKLIKTLALLVCVAAFSVGCACNKCCSSSAKKSCGMACCASANADCSTCPQCSAKK
ncbi:MAG TPA: hypothetical protein PKA41_18235 [Verrucomicrobiota bacterium]|nr:hypothetical protein [Verrucomicrobiota bacterium]